MFTVSHTLPLDDRSRFRALIWNIPRSDHGFRRAPLLCRDRGLHVAPAPAGAHLAQHGGAALAETACHAPAMRVAFVFTIVALGRAAYADTDCAYVLARLDHEVAEAS